MAAQDLGASEWERSKISNQDINLMKKLGLTKKKEAMIFPSEESYPSPPIEYRLHQLTPNSILHVSIFITLCECFLGTQPNWALWKRIFCLRRNGPHNISYNIGGVVICVRPDVEYFDVKFPDSVQGWRKRWLYVREECLDSLEYNIAPFDEMLYRKYSWNWMKQKPKLICYRNEDRVQRGSKRRHRAARPPHGAAKGGPAPRVVWPPQAATDLALPPTYSRSREKPKHPSLHPRKVPSRLPSQALAWEGSEALPGTLPEGDLITGGLYIAMPAFEVMCE
ncbi:hypothetical protein QYE76_027693 [Lolium multiflorum]|uniref:Transposase (putative) gypsy type domain-containing protein n=1 Tax=Lolium multiflorum TaxID=4521 RepID=A0AAD8QJK8_LOLMU|nr:hypothetical protein QYE76_027693 [Lolium multiflorum]